MSQNLLKFEAGFSPRTIVAAKFAFKPSAFGDLDIPASLRESFLAKVEASIIVTTALVQVELVLLVFVFIAYHRIGFTPDRRPSNSFN
jgi:hypothetical protein